jgi:hypothetical protein
MKKTQRRNLGQSLIEALFVVVFTTIIMIAFIQVCIITVDDMVANEAAFVAMRSAAVTKSNQRDKEAEDRVKKYLTFFYPLSSIGGGDFNPSHFVLSSRQKVTKYFKKGDKDDERDLQESVRNNNSSNAEDKSVSIWEGKKTSKDYSGKNITKSTVKIYYFTRVLFGKLVAKDSSYKNRRYQSSRNRMIPSPDEEYYFKSFPKAKSFEKHKKQ